MTPGVLHVQVEGGGRQGEVRRRLAPLGGGAVSRGGDAAPAAATKRAAGSACGTPRRCGEASPKGSAQAATQEEPRTSVWRLCKRSVRAAAFRRRIGHGAAWIECPWCRLDGAGHCTWKAGKHCRPARLHPKDLLDHVQRDHAADPTQWDQALAMLAGVMPGGQAGPFASAQARSRALMLPTGARPAEGRGALPSAAQPGAIGSAAQRGAMTSTGSAAASTSGRQAEGGPAPSAGSQPATAASGWGPRGQGPSRQPPALGAGGPPPSNDPDPARGPGPQAQP